MSIDQNVLLYSKFPIIVSDRPYPHHVPFLLISGRRQQTLNKQENSGKIASCPSHDDEHADDVNNSSSSSLMMKWGGEGGAESITTGRNPRKRNVSYAIAEGSSRHLKISFFSTRGSYPPGALIHGGLMARAIHSQVGHLLLSLDALYGTIRTPFVYIL